MDQSPSNLLPRVEPPGGLPHDSAAFAPLLARHYSSIFARCLKMLGHRQDAEDATQETFSRAIKYIHRWDPRRPLEPWLMTIASNRCRTHLSERRVMVSLSNSELLEIDEDASVQGDVKRQSDRAAAQSLQEEVDFAIRHLPKNHRAAFELFHHEGFDYAQISRQLGCPIGTAKTWVHRARTSLMNELRKREVVPPPSDQSQRDEANSSCPGDNA